MNLSEFITYCTLKGIVNLHAELKMPAYIDDRHFKFHASDTEYDIRLRYQAYNGGIFMMSNTLHCRTNDTTKYNVPLKDIVEAFFLSK